MGVRSSLTLTLGPDRRLQAAFAWSLALHAFALLFIPFARPSPGDELGPVETISFGRIARVQIAHQRASVAAKHPPAAPSIATPRPNQAQNRANVRAPAVSRGPSRLALKVNGSTQHAASTVVAAAPLSMARNDTRAPPDVASEPTVAPGKQAAQPAPSAEQQSAGGTMPVWSGYDEPVVDATTRQALQQLRAKVTLIVVVSDTGKIESIDFDPTDIAPDVKRQIEELLAAARWDTAVCGGVSCRGTARIKI